MALSFLSVVAAFTLVPPWTLAGGLPEGPKAIIDTGTVIGKTDSASNAPDCVNKFLGIPFAITPPERFGPPQPAEKFCEPLIAKEKKSSCPQQFNYPEESRDLLLSLFNDPPVPESEDCLYLNVYAPNKPSPPEGWPVMYWLYPGAFQFGSASHESYDAENLVAHHDVIVVSGNYRTNVFGFPASEQLPVEQRNVGFLDQRLALDWVQLNIQSFGGDPSKVTLFGQSAGAASADLLVALSPEDPPFRAAILQSGSSSLTRLPLGGITGESPWDLLVEGLGCTDMPDALACVREKEPLEIKEYIERSMFSFPTTRDNVTEAADIRDRRLSGNIAKVPILTGTTANEGTLFARPYPSLDSFLNATFSSLPEVQEALNTLYPIGTPGLETDQKVVAAILTDFLCTCPAKLVAEDSSSTGIKTWRYLFNATFPNNEPFPGAGAFHASEVPLVFGTYATEGATPDQSELSNFMMSTWANFTKDPDSGPGWAQLGSDDGNDLALLGQNGSSGFTMGNSERLDMACDIFNPFYSS